MLYDMLLTTSKLDNFIIQIYASHGCTSSRYLASAGCVSNIQFVLRNAFKLFSCDYLQQKFPFAYLMSEFMVALINLTWRGRKLS